MNRRTWIAGLVAAGAVGWSAMSMHAEIQAQEMAEESQESTAEFRPGFLGVAVAETSRSVGGELRAPALVVAGIQPGSPAETAGLQTGDVLIRLEDQRLVHPEQLRRLVMAYPAGQEMSVTLWREGQPQTMTVTLAERPMEWDRPEGSLPGVWNHLPLDELGAIGEFDEMPRLDLDRFDDDAIKQQIKRMQSDLDQHMQAMRKRFKTEKDGGRVGPPVEEAMRHPLLPGRSSLQVLQDSQHRLTIRQDADGRHLHATDSAGNVIYDGPINTETQLLKVPPAILDKIPSPAPQQVPSDELSPASLPPDPPGRGV